MSADHAYTCAACGETFTVNDPEWTDEKAHAEYRENFGGVPFEQAEVVCDDCFQKMKPSLPS